ncbi:hypothetical protein [Burkholderia cepacia]|uniref:hypothetical protein n=1 Tax=Burkholderia cepacia TaxID=292 RepID=UPI0012DAD8ED|nr:hypothetical protein [Burkholderia cepacia]
MRHLEQLAPDVYTLLQRADGLHLRNVCLRVCECVLSYNKVSELSVDKALNCLRFGGECQKDLVNQLDAIVNSLDDRYFELKERADEVENDQDRAQLIGQYNEYFGKARAVAALQFSANSSGFDAAAQAIYEAAASVPDKEAVFNLVKKLLRS